MVTFYAFLNVLGLIKDVQVIMACWTGVFVSFSPFNIKTPVFGRTLLLIIPRFRSNAKNDSYTC
jgi:hypothetical protein